MKTVRRFAYFVVLGENCRGGDSDDLCVKGSVMRQMKRTDLAVEAHQLWRRAEKRASMPGVQVETKSRGPLQTTIVKILDEEGAQALGKPKGTYLSMELGSRYGCVRAEAARQLAGHLKKLLPKDTQKHIMVVGLGNRSVTPDALGPRTVDQLLISRHVADAYQGLRPVSAICPGVKGQTGLESLEIVQSVLRSTEPSCVIVIDALAAAEISHIGSVVQIADTGIQPGSGVGNRRSAFDRKTLGIPVYAIGVPTVTDMDRAESGMIVTSAEIDECIEGMAKMLSMALNEALQPELSTEEIAEFVM